MIKYFEKSGISKNVIELIIILNAFWLKLSEPETFNFMKFAIFFRKL